MCRFTYNCLIHLCAVLGQLEDALMVLNMMHEDRSPDTRPDAYTYAALLRAVAKSKQWKMLPYVYKEIQKSQVGGASGWQRGAKALTDIKAVMDTKPQRVIKAQRTEGVIKAQRTEGFIKAQRTEGVIKAQRGTKDKGSSRHKG